MKDLQTTQTQEHADLQIIRTQELAELLSVSKQTIWRLSKSGELPPKVKISGRAVGWTWGSIREFVEERTQSVTE